MTTTVIATPSTAADRPQPSRLRLLSLIAAAAGAASLASLAGGVARAAGAPPNVLIILTDDQRLGDGSMAAMPQTRRLFGDGGIRYSNAYVTTPQCCPSRASILSGKYAHNHGVLSNGDIRDFDTDEAWPHYLDQAGYQTAYFGKYLNGWPTDVPVPDFDRSFLGFGRRHQRSRRRADLFVAHEAERFLTHTEGNDAAPWAMELGLHSPHIPIDPLHRYADAPVPRLTINRARAETDFTDKNPQLSATQVQGLHRARRIHAGQLRMLKGADDAIAQVFRKMRAGGEGRHTLAFFLSDNGYYWGEHHLLGKSLPYLDSLHVPMYLRWPGGDVRAGTVRRRLAANIDVAPTIFQATGITPSYPVDGRSLLEPSGRQWLLVEGPARTAHTPEPLWIDGYLSGTEHYFAWKSGFEEYYDLRSDPWELRNPLGDGRPGNDPHDLDRIRSEVEAASTCAGASCP